MILMTAMMKITTMAAIATDFSLSSLEKPSQMAFFVYPSYLYLKNK